MFRVFFVCCCMAILSALAPSSSSWGQQSKPAVKPQAASIAQESLNKLGAIVADYVRKDYAVGAELLIVQGGRTLFHQSYGVSDRERDHAWTNDTLCNIRSMTKPITSAAAQILIDRKLLKLDEPVAKYLSSFDNDDSKSITVRQVLTHRSGLPLTTIQYPTQYSSLAEQVAAAGERGPQFTPGSKFWYSDIGTDVVGALIEKVSGEPLHEFVQREVFDPLDMNRTLYGFDASDERLATAASTYLKGSDGWWRFWEPVKPLYPCAWGSQTVYSTTTDYSKFLKMIMNRGRAGDRQLLSAAAVERMLNPVSRLNLMASDVAAPTGFRNLETYYGQMMVTYRPIGEKDAKPVVLGHSGSDGTNAWAWPELDLLILYFTQSRGGFTPLNIEDPIDRLIIHGGKELREDVPENLRPYLGTFIANYGGFDNEEFTVTIRNGKLLLDVPSQMAFELLDPDDDGFWAFAISPSQIKVTFDRDEDDNIVGLKLHKAGKHFEVPRKGTPRAKALSGSLDESSH